MMEFLKMVAACAMAGVMLAIMLLACVGALLLIGALCERIAKIIKMIRMYRRLRGAKKRHKERENERLRVIRNGREE